MGSRDCWSDCYSGEGGIGLGEGGRNPGWITSPSQMALNIQCNIHYSAKICNKKIKKNKRTALILYLTTRHISTQIQLVRWNGILMVNWTDLDLFLWSKVSSNVTMMHNIHHRGSELERLWQTKCKAMSWCSGWHTTRGQKFLFFYLNKGQLLVSVWVLKLKDNSKKSLQNPLSIYTCSNILFLKLITFAVM